MGKLDRGTLVRGICAAALALGACAESKEVPLPECTKGEVKCDPSGLKELVCKAGADGKLTLEAKDCAPGTKCDPATGRCPDLCGECNTPPSECYQREGTCWNGECQYEPADGQTCEDGDLCTVNDVCQGGVCRAGQTKECNFVPADECLSATQLKSYERSGRCEMGDCAYPSTLVDCPLGCENGRCKGDPCEGVTCDTPPSACHEAQGVCSNGACSYLPDDGKACNDNDACTENDACAAGKCTGKPKVCDTPPANSCKDADTLISYNQQGICKAGTCSYEKTEVTCDRGCDSAKGECSDDPCANVKCDTPPGPCFEATGTCKDGKCSYAYDNGKTCDDQDACTEKDVCASGVCKGSPLVCNTAPPNACKDASTLTVYTSPGFCGTDGKCVYGKADVPCSLGCDTATGTCNGDPCATVTCDTPDNPQCQTSPGICSGGNCVYLPKSGVPCDDGEGCTTDDVCKSDGTCEGTAYTCADDGLICTDEVCDGQGGCTHPIKADSCLITHADPASVYTTLRTCAEQDAFRTDNACQRCDPTVSQTTWTGSTSSAPVVSYNFDDGSLQGWVVTVNPQHTSTLVKWQVDAERAVSAPKSLYFGNPAASPRDYSDPSYSVRGTVTSPDITLPAAASAGKLCVEFKMFKDTEASGKYDLLKLQVVEGATTTDLWASGFDADKGITSGAFRSYAVDLSASAGKTVKLAFAFDSIDSLINTKEGVYLDDIRVLKNCTP